MSAQPVFLINYYQ